MVESRACWEVSDMVEKSNVPEIRFAGFADPWEQRKLFLYINTTIQFCRRIPVDVSTPILFIVSIGSAAANNVC